MTTIESKIEVNSNTIEIQTVNGRVPEYQKRARKNYYEKIKNTDEYKEKQKEHSRNYRMKMVEKYGEEYLEERRRKQREYYKMKKEKAKKI